MEENFYAIPLRLDKAMKGKRLEKIDVRLAIHQNIRLILRSFFLRYAFDPTFGSVLNKYQGSIPPRDMTDERWRVEMQEKAQKNLKDILMRYETRVNITDVTVTLLKPEKSKIDTQAQVKVEVQGQLNLGRKEKFQYPDSEICEEALEVFPLMVPVGRI